MILASTLTSKGQATIPAKVRKELNLKTGDLVAFEIIDHKVLVSKIESIDYQYHRSLTSSLSEWNSAEDNEAYNDL